MLNRTIEIFKINLHSSIFICDLYVRMLFNNCVLGRWQCFLFVHFNFYFDPSVPIIFGHQVSLTLKFSFWFIFRSDFKITWSNTEPRTKTNKLVMFCTQLISLWIWNENGFSSFLTRNECWCVFDYKEQNKNFGIRMLPFCTR